MMVAEYPVCAFAAPSVVGNLAVRNRRIFCFYDRVQQLHDAKEFIALWASSWRSFGWEPVVLGMAEVKANPMFPKYREKILQFYSRNVGNYDNLCWLRWLAFEQQGGGVMTDYDVINRCLIPQDITPAFPLIHDSSRVPCCVSADAEGAALIVDYIMGTPSPGQRVHFSDMNLFQASVFPSTKTCIEFGQPGWEEAGCVHFSRFSVHKWNRENKTGTRREDAVRRFIPL